MHEKYQISFLYLILNYIYIVSRGDESVLDVMERLVKADVNKWELDQLISEQRSKPTHLTILLILRLVVVDNDDKVVGIVTVSDIIHFLVLR